MPNKKNTKAHRKVYKQKTKKTYIEDETREKNNRRKIR